MTYINVYRIPLGIDQSINRRHYMNREEETINARSSRVLFSRFIDVFPFLKLDWEKDWAQWTKEILTFFAQLGKKYLYHVYLQPQYGVLDLDEEPTYEYMVDLCWTFEDECMRGYWMELALESEFSQDFNSIMEDFYKLIDIKAFMKIGIFSPKLSERDRVIREMESAVAVSGIRFPFERYLVILILYHGAPEKESERIAIKGYEINYLGDSNEIESKRFPAKLGSQ